MDVTTMHENQQKTRWQLHQERWANCQLCELSTQRSQVVLARGQVPAEMLFCGEAPGVSEDATGEPFCLEENHKVLMADFTWKPLKNIVVGDQIFAPDEEGSDTNDGIVVGRESRRWRVATVTFTRSSTAVCTKVTTSKGDLIGTPDHKVLTAYKTRCKVKRWLEIQQLVCSANRSSSLAFFVKPWEKEETYKAGWIGGFLDGEGHVPKKQGIRKVRCGFGQNSGHTCERAKEYLEELGFGWRRNDNKESKNEKIYVKGGIRKVFELLMRTRPERLVQNLSRFIDTAAPRFYGVIPATIRRIRPRCMMANVVDIKTTTGTFICDGFVVHNCGPAGRLLDRMIRSALQACGITGPPTTAYTNIVACYPRDAKQTDDHRPPAAACKACSARLKEFVGICNPAVVVCVGATATKYVDLSVDTASERITVVHIDHPSAIGRMPQAQQGLAFKRNVLQLAKALEVLR